MDLRKYRKVETLPNGREILIRSIRYTDKEDLQKGFQRLSKQSVHSRFFGGKHYLSEEELEFFTDVDFKSHIAIGARFIDNKIPLGVGRFVIEKEDPDYADVAVTVEESYHGIGIGSALLKHLMAIAKLIGIKHFKADVLASNSHIFKILENSKLEVKQTRVGDYVRISVPI